MALAATLPQWAEHVRRHRTLLGAARASRAASGATDGPVFAGLVGGLGRLPAAVADAIRARGVEIRTNVTVRGIDHNGADGFRLTVGPVPAAEQLETRQVVVAVPAAPAARLLQH